MNFQPLSRSQQKFLFLAGIVAVYVALIAWLDFLQGPQWWDEKTFWETSLTFSDRLFPRLEDLRNYRELNTPLPFIIFGALEYLFGQGIFAGRLLNLVLSLAMIFAIGWPGKDRRGRAILCAIGLFACPYYLWLSGRLYTEMIACAWVLLGFWGYIRNRQLIACVAFILAIASRQYMLAFPVAIVTYEFAAALVQAVRLRRFDLKQQLRWLAPLVATLSIFVWIYLFGGLAPQEAIRVRAPEIQKTIWALSPGVAINFLTFVGCYIVIPEFILFRPLAEFRSLLQSRRKLLLIAVGLLVYFIFFPPQSSDRGLTIEFAAALPGDFLSLAFYYILSFLACLRFLQPNLAFFILFFNCAIMTKAVPWDRYVLPFAVVFWYLKSNGLVDRFTLEVSMQSLDELDCPDAQREAAES